MNQFTSEVKFADGQQIKRNKKRRITEARYFTDNDNKVKEINARITNARSTMQHMRLFWKSSNGDLHWKFTVYTAIIKPKLLYALGTIQLTNSMQKNIGIPKQMH